MSGTRTHTADQKHELESSALNRSSTTRHQFISVHVILTLSFQNCTGFVLNVTATDTDEADNGVIEFRFTLSEDEQYFRLAEFEVSDDEYVCMIFFKEGVVTDRETKEEYIVSIMFKLYTVETQGRRLAPN